MKRVAVIFDNSQRPETTGLYCRRALGELVRDGILAEAEHFLPDEIGQIPPGKFDLFLFVDDGLEGDIPAHLKPSVWWAIDTHLSFERCLRKAKQADFTFAAQQRGAIELRQAGIEHCQWLRLACDPEIHGRVEVPNRHDIAFVGHGFPGERQRLIGEIQQRYPRSFVGNRYLEEMAETYSASKVVFNRSLRDDLNMRVFEGICSGSLVVTNALPDAGQNELFTDGEHLVTYAGDEELWDKLTYYLEHADERERIASEGRREVLRKHTYRLRMETILETFFGLRGSDKRLVLANGSSAVRDSVAAKPPEYFEHERSDVLGLVPDSVRKVLEVGCGGGRLGAAIKARQPAHVTGIELDPVAASRALERLDDVVVGDLESGEIDFASATFDCVICADVLEHLRDPLAALRTLRRWLSPEGILVTSLPNVRNHTVIRSLLAGNWTYESAGLLDNDHVRFFTRREIEKLLFRAGFEDTEMRMVGGEGFAEWIQNGKPQELSIGGLQIRASSEAEAAEFFAYQYLTVSRKANFQRTKPKPQRADPAKQAEQSLRKLRAECPWPVERPDVPLPTEHLGWLGDGSREMLARELSGETRLVVELGSWLGMSARYITEQAPHATVIAVDHWEGSPEHKNNPAWRALLPRLFETFQALTWEQRDRVIPLRMTTQEGLRAIAAAGLLPDVIYFDAEHSYEAVSADLELARELFPDSDLVGDDFDDPGVARAVHECAEHQGLKVEAAGCDWRAWKLVAPKSAVADPRVPESHGLTSIVLVTYGQLEYTRQCVESLRLVTDEPYELIFVDNASTDGTPEYLRSLERDDNVTVILNDENQGFPAGVNQGIEVSTGDNILLLNNDTILTTGWLRRMREALDSSDGIGLVGPVSNNVSGPQQIAVGYSHLNELDGFAWDWGQIYAGQQIETDRLVGFCLLFKREVLNKIGNLDERFGIGNFEDDDFCRRARDAGFRAVIAVDSFVHHFGSVSFQGAGVDLNRLLSENQQKYQQKWNEAPASGPASPEQIKRSIPTDVPPRGLPRPKFVLEPTLEGLNLKPNTVKLSACLIVRDNEETIRPCLESIRPWVDEIVVVDTGSTDETPRICEQTGARVFHWPWRDSFAAARNESVDHARGEWIVWIDSDDTLPEECGRKLRALVEGGHPENVLGYVAQVHCPGTAPDDLTVVDHVKLFRNRSDLRFEFRIHEQVIPAIRRAGGEVAWTDLYVVHSGSDRTEAGQARKLVRDFHLLERELADRPEHPFVLFNLGMTHNDAKQYEPAIDYLRRCLRVSGPDESHVRKAYALLVSSLSQSNRHEEAWEAVTQGRSIFPDDKELLFREALLLHHFKRFDDAERSYLRILQEQTDRHFTSVDPGIAGFKARHNLAVVYEDAKRLEDAEQQWRSILEERPGYIPAWRGLGENLLARNMRSEMAKLFQEISKRSELAGLSLYFRGRIAFERGKLDLARQNFEQSLELAPDDTTTLNALCCLLFEHFSSVDAIPLLRNILTIDKDDAAAWHNLGIAHMNNADWDKAGMALEMSLRLRPSATNSIAALDELRAAVSADRSVDPARYTSSES